MRRGEQPCRTCSAGHVTHAVFAVRARSLSVYNMLAVPAHVVTVRISEWCGQRDNGSCMPVLVGERSIRIAWQGVWYARDATPRTAAVLLFAPKKQLLSTKTAPEPRQHPYLSLGE